MSACVHGKLASMAAIVALRVHAGSTQLNASLALQRGAVLAAMTSSPLAHLHESLARPSEWTFETDFRFSQTLLALL
jgi:hypothetical protein